MLKHLIAITLAAAFSFSMSDAFAKGSTLVSSSGKPVKTADGCAKVAKSGKNDFHYSACHKIKPRKVK